MSSAGLPSLTSASNVSSNATTNVTNSASNKDSQWYFTAEQLANSPSRRHGIDADQELSYRQMTAYLIQEMGQRLQVSQLCINTAIVYMHRFYAFHSFTHFHRNGIAAASLFLAAKVEEQPRKLEHVIKAANKCLNQPTSSTTDAYYLEQAQDLVFNENVLLQTLGFDVAIDHPHTHVVKTCHLVKACKDLAQTSYFLASNSLHLTSMCLQYKPTVVACFCIYLACKWSRWEIPQSTEGKHWFHYVDKTVTMDLLKQLTEEFIAIYEKSPARLKSKLNSIKALAQGASNRVVNKDKKAKPEEWKMGDMMKMYHSSINTNEPSSSSGASTPLPMSSTTEQQPQSSGQAALLPPPPPPHTHQQIRRADSHSSQHRIHHSTSSSHHHAKQAFPTNDVPDPKASTSHSKQQHNTSGSSRPRDHSQFPQNINSISIQPSSSSSGARNSASAAANNNSNRHVLPCGTVSQKLPSQPHDPAFHKSRDRNSLPATSNAPAPPLLQTHKLPPKSDHGRMPAKEHMDRMPEQSKPTANKIFAPAIVSSSGGPAQLSGADMLRNVAPHQRLPPPGYHQSAMSRTINSKHDPSMTGPRQQSQHKHPLSLESQFSTGSSESLQQQSLHTAAISASHSSSRPTDTNMSTEETHSTDSAQAYSSMLHYPGFKPQIQQQTKMPLISPDLNEAMQHHPHLGAAAVSSNKKVERDRNLVNATKKERSRVSYTGIDVPSQSVASVRSSSSAQATQKLQMQKKLDGGNVANVLAGTSALTYASVKRPNENGPLLQDSELSRDSKIRKLDACAPISGNIIGQPYPETRSLTDNNKLQIVNGIETNPDLVRTLLKESLCTANALIKTEPLSSPTLQPPIQLLQSTNPLVKEEKPSVSTLQALMSVEEPAGSKPDKKKKKEKHKHKEKDKSKDREERKKHKKDKERHKSREGEASEPVKIKILKEKLESSSNAGELKIKIPKDRIVNELNIGGNAGNNGNAAADNNSSNVSSPPTFKIKISKDKLENYTSGTSDAVPISYNAVHNQIVANYNSHGSLASGNNGGSSSSSSKKKDRERDREREKDKKRSISDHSKQLATANGGGGSMIGGNSFVTQPSACPKNSFSTKIQQYSSNMSQLFGESNDDDDDDDGADRSYQRPKKSGLSKTVVNATHFAAAQNYHATAFKQNAEYGFINEGSFNIHQHQQQLQQQQQHNHPHLLTSASQQQRQFYHKK